MARLICLAGPQAGSEYVLEGDEMVIGRAADNAVSIPDTSVSRKHVLMRHTPDGWAASDMGSGNGTLINSAAIAEETVLNDGDVITLGDTELRFASGSPAETGPGAIERRPPARRSGEALVRSSRPIVRSSRRASMAEMPAVKARKRTMLIRFGAVAVLLLAAGVGYKSYQQKINDIISRKQAKEQKKLDQLRTLNQEGKNLVREGKWVEAKARFEEVIALDAEYGGAVQDYLKHAEKEIPNQQHLKDGLAAIERGSVAEAFKELGQVSEDTLQSEQRDRLRNGIEQKVDAKLAEARTLLVATNERPKMVQLKEIADDVLSARPDSRDALEYKKTAETQIDRLDHPYVAPPPPRTPWTKVQETFRGGDPTGAFAEAQRCEKEAAQCKQLVGNIRDFIEKNKRLESLGPVELNTLLELDRKISGGQASAASKPISIRLVASSLKTASSAKATGNWARAAEFAKKALWADRENVEAQSILNECNNHAREIYMRAYSIKDSDPDEAARLFKQVIEMTPPDSEYNQKAKARLNKNSNSD